MNEIFPKSSASKRNVHFLRHSVFLIFAVMFLLPGSASALSGPCSDCHAMHWSQGGSVLPEWGAGGPYGGLLTNDCGGCHTGVNDGSAPYVNSNSAPLYDSSSSLGNVLAGGSFYWTSQPLGDVYGHNVAGLTGPDSSLSIPPGWEAGRDAPDGSRIGNGSWPLGQQVTCGGLYGCHGTHSVADDAAALGGAHHSTNLSNDTVTNPGTTVPYDGYRILLGIAGKEDGDWEYSFSQADHNQYKGSDDPGGGTDETTISSLCQRCHGLFHSPVNEMSTVSPWLRHPNDYDMGNSGGEYANYNGGAGYNNLIPLGSTNVSSVISTPNVASAGGTAIITCLSCHRAHGSPYLDSLRWNYATTYTPGGTDGFGGCAVCHSSKN